MVKNYTSKVAVKDSVARIEYRLAQAGATHIGISYSEDKSGRPIGMVFQITINNLPQTFKLPARANNVFEYLRLQRKNPPTKVQLENIKGQADRTAWKILSDWVHLQVSLIELDQAEASEVFFPYLYDVKRDKTIYEIAKINSFQNLLTE